MTNKTKLLPCPFCGNDELTAEPETTYVMCHGCDADGPMTKPGGAITAWNTRASPAEDVRAVVDEQDLFESVFPMPAHATRFKGGYAATEFNAWAAHEFVNKWAGWKARAKFNS